MRRQTFRSVASVMIWIGSVEVVGSFLAKMVFHMTVPGLFNSIFFGLILLGIIILVIARGVW